MVIFVADPAHPFWNGFVFVERVECRFFSVEPPFTFPGALPLMGSFTRGRLGITLFGEHFRRPPPLRLSFFFSSGPPFSTVLLAVSRHRFWNLGQVLWSPSDFPIELPLFD